MGKATTPWTGTSPAIDGAQKQTAPEGAVAQGGLTSLLGSVQRNLLLADQLVPALHFAADQVAVLLGRAAHGLNAEVHQLLPDGRLVDRCGHLLLQ